MPFDIKEEVNKLRHNASNSDNAKQLFRKRSIYSQFAFSSTAASLDPKVILPIRNFQKYENYMYGRIDTDFLAVVPKKILFNSFTDSSNSSFGFVSSAFESMKREIRRDVATGKIPADVPFISDMKAYKSFEDINTKYNLWVETALKRSFPAYLKKFNKKDKIFGFDSFLRAFREHLMMIIDQVNSVTFSSFCLTSQSNIRNSGLCVEIANLDFSKDSDKEEFSANPYFSYYVSIAEKYGFFVDYNAPWRLVFNLASEVTTGKESWSGLYTFFSNNYQSAHNQDLTILKNLAFTTYRDFANRFRSFVTTRVEPNGCIKKTRHRRQKYTKEEFDQNYPDRYWLNFYIDLKNAEKNLDFDRNELERIKKKSLEYEKHVDIRRSMGYINKVFQDIPSVEGSFYYKLNQVHYRDQDPLPFEEFDRYIQEVVKSYKLK